MSDAPEKAPRFLTIPNQLTLSRFAMAIAVFVLIDFQQWWACLAVFVLATFTDWLDGFLARRMNQTSALGRVIDPLADKVLVCGAYVHLLPLGREQGWLAAWMVTLILSRELIITTLRSYVESQGIKFGADWLGKVKMVLQSAALAAIFVTLGTAIDHGDVIRDVLIYGMLLSTLVSGLQYLWRAIPLLQKV